MRKFPYFVDVAYSSGRNESIKVTTSQQAARVKTQLDHMKVSGLVQNYANRAVK